MSNNLNLSGTDSALLRMGDDVFGLPALPLSLEISTVEEPQHRDETLDRAVNRLIPAALEYRHGILVIERDYGTYTVRVDPEVPCGTIQERRHQS